MVVIPHDKNLDKKEKDDISDRLTSDIDDIVSGISISPGEMRDKELEPIRKQYLDKDKITENFGVKVAYNNSTELTIQN